MAVPPSSGYMAARKAERERQAADALAREEARKASWRKLGQTFLGAIGETGLKLGAERLAETFPTAATERALREAQTSDITLETRMKKEADERAAQDRYEKAMMERDLLLAKVAPAEAEPLTDPTRAFQMPMPGVASANVPSPFKPAAIPPAVSPPAGRTAGEPLMGLGVQWPKAASAPGRIETSPPPAPKPFTPAKPILTAPPPADIAFPPLPGGREPTDQDWALARARNKAAKEAAAAAAYAKTRAAAWQYGPAGVKLSRKQGGRYGASREDLAYRWTPATPEEAAVGGPGAFWPRAEGGALPPVAAGGRGAGGPAIPRLALMRMAILDRLGGKGLVNKEAIWAQVPDDVKSLVADPKTAQEDYDRIIKDAFMSATRLAGEGAADIVKARMDQRLGTDIAKDVQAFLMKIQLGRLTQADKVAMARLSNDLAMERNRASTEGDVAGRLLVERYQDDLARARATGTEITKDVDLTGSGTITSTPVSPREQPALPVVSLAPGGAGPVPVRLLNPPASALTSPAALKAWVDRLPGDAAYRMQAWEHLRPKGK